MAGMLYYPFANAPLPVLYQAVLCWDDLATVVAPGWENRIDERMRAVRDAGLYRPIEPCRSFEPIELGAIQAELDYALARIPLDDLIPPKRDVEERTNMLHVEKIHDSVAVELRRRGFVREVPGAPGRLLGSRALVQVVVSIIADRIATDANRQLGFTAKAGLRPHTDTDTAHRLGVEPIPGS
jgi:hypothetical protein